VNDYNYAYKALTQDVRANYELYLESLKTPLPFYLGTPSINEDVLTYTWDEAYDFDAADVTYLFQVAQDWNFNNILFQNSLVNLTSTETEILKPGVYYWHVIATNKSGFIQYPFDSYYDAQDIRHEGMKSFEITQDGQVLEK